MCLCINLDYHKANKNHKPITLVAEQTILVHKMVEKDDNNHLYTPYNYMPINFDDEYGMFFYKTTKFSFENGCGDAVYVIRGIHTFAELENAKDSVDFLSNGCGANVSIYNAVIPKGSKFFIGKDGDIVSSNLVVFKNKTKYNKNKKYFGDVPIEFSAYLKKFGIEVDSK